MPSGAAPHLSAAPHEVTFYTRCGCHLCDEAKALLLLLLAEFRLALREIDVDSDPALAAEFGNDVPVIFLGARKAAKHRIDLARFRRLLESTRE